MSALAGNDQRTHLERNAAGLERLHALGEALLAGHLEPRLGAGWTPSAVFAHLAFWDRFVVARWDRYDRDGVIEPLPDLHLDLVNDAGMPLWLALDPAAAVAQAIAAGAAVCGRIALLSQDAVEHVVATGRLAMLDRTLHWSPHCDELDRPRRGRGPGDRPRRRPVGPATPTAR